MALARRRLPLFGGQRAWNKDEWTSNDDRVRGGSSRSSLTIAPTLDRVAFEGVLDTSTLGGAGFASQRTISTSKLWDLSAFDGLELVLGRGDGKRYTLNLKNEMPEKREDGRDKSTLEYAFSFNAPATTEKYGVFVPWNSFEPYYRGRKQKNAKSLDTSSIRRFSIMIRSFFDKQEGEFSLRIFAILAIKMQRPRALRECPSCNIS